MTDRPATVPIGQISQSPKGIRRELIAAALGHYGEPARSLQDLREAVAQALPDTPLGELIVRERAASG